MKSLPLPHFYFMFGSQIRLEGERSFWRVPGHESLGMKSSVLTFLPRLLTSFYKDKYLFSNESVRRFSRVKCPCIQKNWHLCSLNQFPKIMQHILMVLRGPTVRVSEKWGWTFYMSPKQINLCPAPSEEIIKQNVTNPEVMGETTIIPEMVFVKIVMACHLPILD